MTTKWAICSTGKISNDFCTALKLLPESEHQICAVAARDSKEKAEAFAANFDIPVSCATYADLLNVPGLDVVYIGTIHTFHVETSLMFINAGLNVLCEKPMALGLEGCNKVLAAAKEKNVLFVEAVWSRFFPAYKFIKEQLAQGALGEVKSMQASFNIPIVDVARIKERSLGGGGLLDIGIYVVQAANFVFNEKPEKVVVEGVKSDEKGVDLCANIIIRYKGGRFALLNYGVLTDGDFNSMIIRGTKGNFEVPSPFWCPDKIILPDRSVKTFKLLESKAEHKFNFVNSQGLAYQAQGVRRCLLEGLKECPEIPHADSQSNFKVMQQVLDTLDITYDTL